MSAQATMQVQVPQGAVPGTQIQVQAPNGLTLQVPVPEGLAPGQVFNIQYPVSAAPAAMPQLPQETEELEFYSPLPDKRFDVTDYIESFCLCLWFPCNGWMTKTLLVGDQEVTLKTRSLLRKSTQRRPYAQLGSVERHEACGICFTISSDLAPVNEKGEGGIKVGFGCDAAATDAIVQELQSRKVKRGNIAQMKKLDLSVQKMAHMRTVLLPALMNKLGLTYQTAPPTDTSPEVFPTKSWDVTNYIEMICGCCIQKSLELGPDEATLRINGPFQNVDKKREYAQLGNVQRIKSCVCCYAVSSDMGPIAPGMGCSGGLVGEIVQELRSRMQARGEIGQMRRQDKIITEMKDVVTNLPNAVRKMGAEWPPSQSTLSSMYPSGKPPVIGAAPSLDEVLQKEPFAQQVFDVTNYIEAFCALMGTCCIAGWTKQTLELEADQLTLTIKNNLDDSKLHQPYGELESVDASKACCCCHVVNGMSPGCGCDGDKVSSIAAELQKRKVARGNIRQLKQLESMQAASIDLGVQADLMLKQKGIPYPPNQEVMMKTWGGAQPKILSRDAAPPHIEPQKQFETKTFDVTNYIESCCTCLCTCCLSGPTTVSMELGPDEVLWTTKNFCFHGTTRQAYAQLGAVETEQVCCCCYELPEVASPGFGCSKDLVDTLAAELQERKVYRGNIAQIMMQENLIMETLKVSAKMDLLLSEMGCQVPKQQQMGSTTVVAPTNYGKGG